PLDKATLELLSIEMTKDTPEGIVCRWSTGQGEKACEPFLLGRGVIRHGFPVVRTADNGTNADNQQVDKQMRLIDRLAWISQVGKTMGNSFTYFCAHPGNPPLLK